MNKFEEPTIEVKNFNVDDIITTSGGIGGDQEMDRDN